MAISVAGDTNMQDLQANHIQQESWSYMQTAYSLTVAAAIQGDEGYIPNDGPLVPASVILQGLDHGSYLAKVR
jgi:hypothetical protein